MVITWIASSSRPPAHLGTFCEHAPDRLLVDFTRTHVQIVRFLEPVKAIQVHLFKPKTFVIGQSDGDGVFMGGDEFERAVVIIMDSFVSEGFICTAHGDVVAVLVPADIYFVTRHAIEVRERAFNGLAVDICPVHESYFQFESKKLLAGFFIPCCSSRNSKNRATSMPRAIPTIATTNSIAAKWSCESHAWKTSQEPNRSLADVIRLNGRRVC